MSADRASHRASGDTAPEPAPVTVTSEALMAGQRRLNILHDGELYVLQITRQNKLLLTK